MTFHYRNDIENLCARFKTSSYFFASPTEYIPLFMVYG